MYVIKKSNRCRIEKKISGEYERSHYDTYYDAYKKRSGEYPCFPCKKRQESSINKVNYENLSWRQIKNSNEFKFKYSLENERSESYLQRSYVCNSNCNHETINRDIYSGNTKELNYDCNNNINEMVTLGVHRWEEELFNSGKGRKRPKLCELEQKTNILTNSESKTFLADKFIVRDRSSLSNYGNEFNKLFNKNETFNHLDIEVVCSENDCNNYNVNRRNDLENVPIVNYTVSGNKSDSISSMNTLPYIVIDYKHEDKCLNNEVIERILYDSTVNNEDEEPIINLSLVQDSTKKIVQDNVPSSNEKNDLMKLANLVVNKSSLEKNEGTLNKNINKSSWKLIKLCTSEQIIYSRYSIDLTRCHQDDPRVKHLR